MTRPFCRRCLLEDMPSQAELARSVQELVDMLPEDQRAPEPERLRRLSHCRSCDHLMDGMCALCGCYVELRAAKQRMICPDLPNRWREEARAF